MTGSRVILRADEGKVRLCLEGLLQDSDFAEIRRCVREAKACRSSEPIALDLAKALWISEKCLDEIRLAADELGRLGDGMRLIDASSDLADWLTVKKIVPAIPHRFSASLKSLDELMKRFFTGNGKRIAIVDDDAASYETTVAPLLTRGFDVRWFQGLPKIPELPDIQAAIVSLDILRCDPFNVISLLRDLRVPMLAAGMAPDPTLRRKAELLGVRAIATRPCPRTDLLAFMETLARAAAPAPRTPPEARVSLPPDAGDSPAGPKKILVVDDSGFVRRQMTQFLEPSCKIIAMKDGLEALDALQGVEPLLPDVIFLDVEMPRLNGLQFLRRIRDDESLKSIPVIMISSVRERDKIVEAMKLGVKDYIMKPLTCDMVYQRLERLLPSWTKPVGGAEDTSA